MHWRTPQSTTPDLSAGYFLIQSAWVSNSTNRITSMVASQGNDHLVEKYIRDDFSDIVFSMYVDPNPPTTYSIPAPDQYGIIDAGPLTFIDDYLYFGTNGLLMTGGTHKYWVNGDTYLIWSESMECWIALGKYVDDMYYYYYSAGTGAEPPRSEYLFQYDPYVTITVQ